MSEHSPTPWATPGIRKVLLPNGEAPCFEASIIVARAMPIRRIARLDFGYGSEANKADLDIIVTAVNAHDALVRALKELADLVDEIREGAYTPDSFTTQPARAALKLAGVTP